MTLGVLGGSFDPVHRGHQALVAEVLAAGLADEVLVLPAWLSPHKEQTSAPAGHRLAMVELAFADWASVAVDVREIDAGRVCYTVDTLAALAGENPGARLRLIIGADNLAALTRWHEPARLLELAEVIVAGRGDGGPDLGGLVPEGLPTDRFVFLPDFRHPASSSLIRRKMAAGDLPADLLPSAVVAYIRNRGLYGLSGKS